MTLKVKTYPAILKRIQKAEDEYLNGDESIKLIVGWDNDNEDVDGTGRYYSATGHLPDRSFKITIDRQLDKTTVSVKNK